MQVVKTTVPEKEEAQTVKVQPNQPHILETIGPALQPCYKARKLETRRPMHNKNIKANKDNIVLLRHVDNSGFAFYRRLTEPKKKKITIGTCPAQMSSGWGNVMGRFKCFTGSKYSHNMLIEEVIIPQPNSHSNWDISTA